MHLTRETFSSRGTRETLQEHKHTHQLIMVTFFCKYLASMYWRTTIVWSQCLPITNSICGVWRLMKLPTCMFLTSKKDGQTYIKNLRNPITTNSGFVKLVIKMWGSKHKHMCVRAMLTTCRTTQQWRSMVKLMLQFVCFFSTINLTRRAIVLPLSMTPFYDPFHYFILLDSNPGMREVSLLKNSPYCCNGILSS
jgi:hypothetical protein